MREQVDALYRSWHTRQVASAFAAIIRRLGASAWRGLSRPLGKFINATCASCVQVEYSSTRTNIAKIVLVYFTYIIRVSLIFRQYEMCNNIYI